MLVKLGWQPIVFANGQELLEAMMQSQEVSMVLMDLHMPVMDGYTAAQRIRQWEKEGGRVRRPIIALTAAAFEEDRRRCLEAGMDEVLTKPIGLATLSAALEKWSPIPSGEKI